ncbi:MAG TPA: hypothetical protein PKE63_03915 [Lacibacter sp.]|nr:hypothetical protein [Lacibacter sp.]HMO89577.1 hypothetical protein [Lacibacter sp.]HMP86396.1 hypothetical protein [Lacibacter sp.]
MLQLVTHRPGQQQPPFSFFILSKGNNSGKPLDKPCPNCFVASCSNEDEREFFYWLCWGLWQAKAFEHFLTGSVIPFLRKRELQQILHKQTAGMHPEEWRQAVVKARQLHEHETNVRKQLQLLGQLKCAFIRSQLRL